MSRNGKIREIIEVSQAELNEIAQQYNSIRVGATKDLDVRANQYEREGYSGIMYIAKTTNMQYAEDKLLEHDTRHNIHKTSNVDNGSGYVYVINGKKYK